MSASDSPALAVSAARQPARLRPTLVLMAACTLLVGCLVLVPSGSLLWESATRSTSHGASIDFANYGRILGRQRSYALLLTTIAFSAVTTLFAGAVGFVFAWISARTNTPGRRFMPIAVLLPYLLPPSLGAIIWILLLSPSNGIVNTLIEPVLGPAFFNIYSFPGMVFVESLYAFPLSFMFFHASLTSLNPALEEASLTCGAGTMRTFFRVTLPSMWPTILSVATILFIVGFESFDVAWFLGYPAKIFILSIEIYVLTQIDFPPDIAGAAVYGVIALICAFGLVTLYRRVTRNRERFAAITGKNYRAGVLDIGRAGYVACAAFYGIIVVIGVLPLLLLAAISLDAVSWPFALTGSASLASYQWVFGDGDALHSLLNSLEIALLGAFAVTAASFVIGYLSMRTNERGRGLLDYLSFLPFAFPGTVLAVGVMTTMVSTPLYNTIWIVLLALCIKFLPYGLRNLSNNLLQIHPELEEASHIAGGGLLRTMRAIVLPLTRPGLIASWALLFVVFMRQFSLPIMLGSPGSQVATVTIFQEWDAGGVDHVAALGIVLALACVPFVVAGRLLVGRSDGSI